MILHSEFCHCKVENLLRVVQVETSILAVSFYLYTPSVASTTNVISFDLKLGKIYLTSMELICKSRTSTFRYRVGCRPWFNASVRRMWKSVQVCGCRWVSVSVRICTWISSKIFILSSLISLFIKSLFEGVPILGFLLDNE